MILNADDKISMENADKCKQTSPRKLPRKMSRQSPLEREQLATSESPEKLERKKRDRFNGKTEEEVLKMTLPDHLHEGLDIIIIGINPGLTAAHVGHHYAGPGNHFWKCLFLSGLIPHPMNAYDDYKLREHGIGFTNIVERTSRGSADLSKSEIKEGAAILTEKIKKFKPKIAVFNGKGIYEVFCGHKNFHIGKQPQPFPDTAAAIFVMPSSSARCSQLPRAVDKVPFYLALRKLRDKLIGRLDTLEDSEVCFPDLELKVVKKEPGIGSPEKKPMVKEKQRKVKAKSFAAATSKDAAALPCLPPYSMSEEMTNFSPCNLPFNAGLPHMPNPYYSPYFHQQPLDLSTHCYGLPAAGQVGVKQECDDGSWNANYAASTSSYQPPPLVQDNSLQIGTYVKDEPHAGNSW